MIRILNFLKPAPAQEQIITESTELKANYRYWRTRIMYTSMIGYILFYFVRKNISIAMPAMEADLGISKAKQGLQYYLDGDWE